MASPRLLCLISLALTALPAHSQAISAKQGNIYFTTSGGQTRQLTNLGLDLDPRLSLDSRLAVFVRRTPTRKIDTGLGDTDENELWIAGTSGARPPRRILAGHPGGYDPRGNLVLAGFAAPQFSPDATRIYFVAQVWATASSLRMLDLASGSVRFLCSGLTVEVLQSGRYAGHLIILKEIPSMLTARIFRFWLLDADGNDVGEIGGDEFNPEPVRQFKREFN